MEKRLQRAARSSSSSAKKSSFGTFFETSFLQEGRTLMVLPMLLLDCGSFQEQIAGMLQQEHKQQATYRCHSSRGHSNAFQKCKGLLCSAIIKAAELSMRLRPHGGQRRGAIGPTTRVAFPKMKFVNGQP